MLNIAVNSFKLRIDDFKAHKVDLTNEKAAIIIRIASHSIVLELSILFRNIVVIPSLVDLVTNL